MPIVNIFFPCRRGILIEARFPKDCLSIHCHNLLVYGKRLALPPPVNVDNTWLASRTNDTPYDILITLVDLLMFGKCTVREHHNQYLMLTCGQTLKNIRYESEISRTQVLPLVAALANNRAIAGE
jgi:hypothetical protein